MRKNTIFVLMTIGVASLALASCWQDTVSNDIPDQNQSDVSNPVQSNANLVGPDQGQRPGPDMGSGSYRGGFRSGSGWFRRGTGSLRGGSGAMMQGIAPEDRALFQAMMDARRSGDTEKMNQIRDELQKKYPNLPFGSGSRRSGSGESRFGGTGTNQGEKSDSWVPIS